MHFPSSPPLPTSIISTITHPNQLKWNKRMLPGTSTPLFFPCRVIVQTSQKKKQQASTVSKRRRKINNDDDLSFHSHDDDTDDGEDDDEEVQIEYITSTNLLVYPIQRDELSSHSKS